MSANLVIGIDPGKNTGFAVYDRSKKRLVSLWTIDFGLAIRKLEANHSEIDHVRIERPKTKYVWQSVKRQDLRAAMNIAFRVGMNQREAQLLISECRRRQFRVVEMNPQGKIDQQRFRMLTGWEGRTNEHIRDAGMLCYGF